MANPNPQPFAAVSQRLDLTPSITPVSVNANTTSVQTFNVTGLDSVAHQFIEVAQFAWNSGAQSQTAGIVVAECWVSAAGVISISFLNTTGGSLTPAAGQYAFTIF